MNIKIQNGMKLRYYIYTYQGRTFAVDGHFTDGNSMRDLNNGGYLTDQNGVRIQPLKAPMEQALGVMFR